ncbi:MAG: class II fructose-bisphosphatase [Dissulfurimicrobium sp.]|uniref:class II fructose-bisphosphatase n=1 Tax=Dissulfurimicrobium TaxID=1769732 RepID=UPI001EDB3296|nr:class II fructose-bisphosphatase [Dissulfurimicrobium hydrothermale]UKL14115.1 class II fructose-bisphosphatase [Dissulfurimicrobium hydrothermale]
MKETPQHNLGIDLGRVTEAAALTAARWMGKGDKEKGDKAAVDAMRISFDSVDIRGVVVIGEGEKDKAPMLFNGEQVGSGRGPEMDVAVDPVEGTRLLAYGRPNAISVVAAAPRGSMYDPGPAFYMKKLVAPAEARGKLDIKAPVADNLKRVAQALGKDVDDLVVFVLDKERHRKLVQEIRAAGARIQLHTDGDVAGALMAVMPGTGVDLMMGTGGTPEGVLAATAIRIMGGEMQGMLDPQSDAEKKAVLSAGYRLEQVLTTEELIRGDDVFFAATGITGGSFLRGVEFTGKGARTFSMVMRGLTGTIRYIEAHHNLETLMRISAIKYD